MQFALMRLRFGHLGSVMYGFLRVMIHTGQIFSTESVRLLSLAVIRFGGCGVGRAHP